MVSALASTATHAIEEWRSGTENFVPSGKNYVKGNKLVYQNEE